MASFTIKMAKNTLTDLVARAEAGEEIVLMRGKHPVAKIVPVSPKRRAGAYRGKISVPDSFFEPLPEDELSAWE